MSTPVNVKRRSIHLFVIVASLFTGLAAKLVAIQAFGRATGAPLRMVTKVITPPRGSILDRNGVVLATSATQHWATLNPRHVDSPTLTADLISEHLGIRRREILGKMRPDLPAKDRPGYIVLKKNVAEHEVEFLEFYQSQLNASRRSNPMSLGIHFQTFSRRQYPLAPLASQVIGIVSFRNLREAGDRIILTSKLRSHPNRIEVGESGIERGLDGHLAGQPGYIRAEADARGSRISGGKEEVREPVAGYDVVLTIDEHIQRMVEEALDRCRRQFNARYVTAVVMRTHTGEILAMASSPAFDPRDYSPASANKSVNWAASAVYEPGSTFKVLVAAAAIESLPDWNHVYASCSGKREYGNRVMRCWILGKRGHGHGVCDLSRGIRDSCNMTMAAFGERLGARRMREYMRRFGLFEKSGEEFLPGERLGSVLPADQTTAVTLAGMSFGQHFSTTPIALLRAVNAIANSGTLVHPYLIKEIRSQDGSFVRRYSPRVQTSVIQPGTAHLVREMMEQVVKRGTGKAARIPGIRVAGKTGTAQKAIGRRGYVPGKYVCSFVGFLPADKPELSIIVVANEPDEPSGGTVAAPYFKEIAQRTLARLRRAPVSIASRS